MLWNPDGTRQPTCIFEAACWHYAVQPVCSCGHKSTFDPHGLWWLFECRRWDDSFAKARERFWCRFCAARFKKKYRAARLEVVKRSACDMTFPMPDEREWKRAVSRFRS